MLVKDLMSSSVNYVFPEDDLEKLTFLMRSEDVGILPVCDRQRHVLGVITDRDIVLRALRTSGGAPAVEPLTEQSPAAETLTAAEALTAAETLTAADLMSRNVITVNSGDDIHQAALKFSKYALHRLPVVENQRLVGILSLKDLARKKVFTAEIGHIIYNIYNHR